MEENTVNAVAEEVVTPQEPVETEVVESVESEVATDTQVEEVVEVDEKPVQSKEDNAKYADVRRKAEQAAQDKLIDEMYGKSHDIHTKAEYDKAMAKQKQEEVVKQMKEGETTSEQAIEELKKQWEKNDPRLQEYEKIKTESYTAKQLTELNSELKDMGLDSIESLEDISKLESADKVVEYINDGKTLSEAYFLANKKNIITAQAEKIQQDTIKKIQANSDASTGSLANTSTTEALYTRAQVDAMSQSEVNKNYDLVMKSMKTW